MAITPVNVARVTQNLQAFNLLNTVRGSNLGLFRTQNQLATGLRFLTPSEDPTRAITSLRLDRRLDTLKSVGQNLQSVNATLTAGEAAMQDAVNVIREAYTTALGAVNDTVPLFGDVAVPEPRRVPVAVVDAPWRSSNAND